MHAAMTSAQLFIRLGADLMESSVGGWQIPDGPDQMVAAVYFYRAKNNFPISLLIDDPTELQRGHECSPGNKMSWAIVSKLKTCWITVAAEASVSFLQPLQTNSQRCKNTCQRGSDGLLCFKPRISFKITLICSPEKHSSAQASHSQGNTHRWSNPDTTCQPG